MLLLDSDFFYCFFFFFNDTATTEIYTLSLHDALPIFGQFGNAEQRRLQAFGDLALMHFGDQFAVGMSQDRKSTRLNSSHANISYAVFCLKKKTQSKSGSTYSCNGNSRSS